MLVRLPDPLEVGTIPGLPSRLVFILSCELHGLNLDSVVDSFAGEGVLEEPEVEGSLGEPEVEGALGEPKVDEEDMMSLMQRQML